MDANNGITVITPKSLAEAKDLSTTLAASRLLPEALAKSPSDVLAVIMAGAELGLLPMQSIRGIAVIKGKPTLSADTMGALVKSRADVCKYMQLVESSTERAEYETQRVGDPRPTKMAFTLADAQRAGLVTGGGMYSKYPAQMLRARALAAICRAVYPDVVLGLYDPEELEDVAAPRVERPVNATPPPALRIATPQTEGQMVDALAASIEALPQKPSAERESLFLAIDAATSLDEVNALVPRMTALRMAATDELRIAWGKKRDVLRANEVLSGVSK